MNLLDDLFAYLHTYMTEKKSDQFSITFKKPHNPGDNI